MSLVIQITLTRDNESKNDDRILIRKNFATNEFVLTYIDPTPSAKGTPTKERIVGMYHAQVMEYIYMLLKNQYIDEEKYKQLQISLPAMPSMILSVDKLSDLYYRDHLQELISFGLDTLDNASKANFTREARDAAVQRRFTRDAEREEALRREMEREPYSRPQHLFFDDE